MSEGNSNLDLQDNTLARIVELAREGIDVKHKLSVVPIPNHPTGAVWVVDKDGDYEIYGPPQKPRRDSLYSVDQVPNYALHGLHHWDAFPAIYYQRERVVIEMESSSIQRSRAGCAVELEPTPVWEMLTKWNEGEPAWFSQKNFIRLIRTKLVENLSDAQRDQIVDAIRYIEFSAGERTVGNIQRGREQMGKEVLAEMKTMREVPIPEEVVLSVRIFTDPALLSKHQITCLLETNPAAGQFALVPISSEITMAMDNEMSALGDMLRSSLGQAKRLTGPAADDEEADDDAQAVDWQIPVFYGAP